jgi:signal transduction histidine kinase
VEEMDKLFRSFSQIDESITRSFGGSGLGLIISKDLARLLGGDCTASSEYGSGSKFTFSLVAERDASYSRQLRKFDKPRSCFIICDAGPWWEMLQEK